MLVVRRRKTELVKMLLTTLSHKSIMSRKNGSDRILYNKKNVLNERGKWTHMVFSLHFAEKGWHFILLHCVQQNSFKQSKNRQANDLFKKKPMKSVCWDSLISRFLFGSALTLYNLDGVFMIRYSDNHSINSHAWKNFVIDTSILRLIHSHSRPQSVMNGIITWNWFFVRIQKIVYNLIPTHWTRIIKIYLLIVQ